jgi:Fe-S oxidoreductase
MNVPLHLAKEQDVRALGLEPVPGPERPAKLLARLAEVREAMRSLSVMLETCTKCGNCMRQCHSYLGTEDYHNSPAARADLVRKVYRRHFTVSGRLLGRLAGAEDVDDETIDRWATYFYQCNECRRCAVFCPFGIDTAEITIAARHILTSIGVVPKFMQAVAVNLRKTGNNMGIPKPALLDSVEFLEGELKEETGRVIRIPVDKPGSRILYVPSSADFFTNVDTILGAAKLFHVLGADWTVSSAVLEAANFGLLFHWPAMREHNRRLKEAAEALGAEVVIQGECGHGWRAARLGSEGASGPVPFRLRHVLEYAAENLARLPLRRLEMRVALHDPCNYVRGGGIVEAPRPILRAIVEDVVEMTPNRQQSFCCGGGSGLLMDEMMDVRMKLGRQKAEQVRTLGRLDYLAAPCSICKAQLPHVFKHYGLGELPTGGILDLLGKAIAL